MTRRKTLLGVLAVAILFALPAISQGGDPCMLDTASGITQTFSASACQTGSSPYPLSSYYGGSNGTLDTNEEVSAAIAALVDNSFRDSGWPQFSPEDRVTMVSDEAYVAWGEELPPADDATTDNFSDVVDVWDTQADPPEDPFPADETFAEWDIDEPALDDTTSAIPIVIAVVGGLRAGCYAFCDDAIRLSGKVKPLFSKVKKSKKPRKYPKNWRTKRADPGWRAGARPARELRQDLARAGETPPAPTGYVAHHIVASGSRFASTAQQVMVKCLPDIGITPNSAANGVWIREDLHRGMHTQHYYNNVNRTLARQYYFGGGLSQSARCARVQQALAIAKDALRSNAFPL